MSLKNPINKLPKVSPAVATIGAAVILYALNWFSVQLFTYPFLVCWTAPWLTTVYLAWGKWFLLISVGFVIFQLWRRNYVAAGLGALIFMAIIELPRLADNVFRLGGTCGG